MTIKNANLKFARAGTKRDLSTLDEIILHHTASKDASPETIHKSHLLNGWIGSGYHILVRKDGSVWKLRPIKFVGAHCVGHNKTSIGICFEGNFTNEKMKAKQLKAGKEAIAYYMKKYNIKKVKLHRDYNSTECPGSIPEELYRKDVSK